MLDCEADWIECSGRFFSSQELWEKAGMVTEKNRGVRLGLPFHDKMCMVCLRRSGWKEEKVYCTMLF